MNSEAISDKFKAAESVLNFELHHKNEITLTVCEFVSNSYCIALPSYT